MLADTTLHPDLAAFPAEFQRLTGAALDQAALERFELLENQICDLPASSLHLDHAHVAARRRMALTVALCSVDDALWRGQLIDHARNSRHWIVRRYLRSHPRAARLLKAYGLELELSITPDQADARALHEAYMPMEQFTESPHFLPHEWSCNCGCGAIYQEAAQPLMTEKLRALGGGRGIDSISAFRCERHNDAVGGHPNSRHRRGGAMDIDMHKRTGDAALAFVAYAKEAGFAEIGHYSRDLMLHVAVDDQAGEFNGNGMFLPSPKTTHTPDFRVENRKAQTIQDTGTAIATGSAGGLGGVLHEMGVLKGQIEPLVAGVGSAALIALIIVLWRYGGVWWRYLRSWRRRWAS